MSDQVCEPVIVQVSGHLNVTPQEFAEHYRERLRQYHLAGAVFVVGDARGADKLAQAYLSEIGAKCTVYHMFGKPRNNVGNFPTVGGFKTDDERDAAMTRASHVDVAWVRPGREDSGTARNLARREQLKREAS